MSRCRLILSTVILVVVADCAYSQESDPLGKLILVTTQELLLREICSIKRELQGQIGRMTTGSPNDHVRARNAATILSMIERSIVEQELTDVQSLLRFGILFSAEKLMILAVEQTESLSDRLKGMLAEIDRLGNLAGKNHQTPESRIVERINSFQKAHADQSERIVEHIVEAKLIRLLKEVSRIPARPSRPRWGRPSYGDAIRQELELYKLLK
ncbi:MAG: hypothetical protein EXS16_08060 [Gemmataceae bacterium]|nr:hypothetical protein [Gemmataceae bacterium]